VRLILENKQQEILLNKEFRYELNAYDWRLPWWKVVDSLDEYVAILDADEDLDTHVLDAAKREWKEEVGIEIVEASLFQKLVCGTTMEWDLYYVKVEKYNQLAVREVESGWEEYAIAWHEWFSYAKVQDMLKKGLIQEWRSASVLTQIVFADGV
jgi:hypothetical protein